MSTSVAFETHMDHLLSHCKKNFAEVAKRTEGYQDTNSRKRHRNSQRQMMTLDAEKSFVLEKVTDEERARYAAARQKASTPSADRKGAWEKYDVSQKVFREILEKNGGKTLAQGLSTIPIPSNPTLSKQSA